MLDYFNDVWRSVKRRAKSLKLIKRDIKFAGQRLIRGWDDSETWALDSSPVTGSRYRAYLLKFVLRPATLTECSPIPATKKSLSPSPVICLRQSGMPFLIK